MSKQTYSKVLTANRLSDGNVVFYTAMGIWALGISDAVVAKEPLAQQALEKRGAMAEIDNQVTDSYLIDVEIIDGRVRPLHIRERIRTRGPTIREDLGKQATALGGSFDALGAAL